MSRYKWYIAKAKYKASEEIYNFHKITEYSVLLYFLLVFVLASIFGNWLHFLTYNFLSEYDSILFMNLALRFSSCSVGYLQPRNLGNSRTFLSKCSKNYQDQGVGGPSPKTPNEGPGSKSLKKFTLEDFRIWTN